MMCQLSGYVSLRAQICVLRDALSYVWQEQVSTWMRYPRRKFLAEDAMHASRVLSILFTLYHHAIIFGWRVLASLLPMNALPFLKVFALLLLDVAAPLLIGLLARLIFCVAHLAAKVHRNSLLCQAVLRPYDPQCGESKHRKCLPVCG